LRFEEKRESSWLHGSQPLYFVEHPINRRYVGSSQTPASTDQLSTALYNKNKTRELVLPDLFPLTFNLYL
jgi:hypothetical protein